MLSCIRGPAVPPATGEVDYPVTAQTESEAFPGGVITVTCVFDIENGGFVLDRNMSLDCFTYGTLTDNIFNRCDRFLNLSDNFPLKTIVKLAKSL